MKPKLSLKQKIAAIFSILLLCSILGYIAYSLVPSTARNMRLLGEPVALAKFADIVTLYGRNTEQINIQSQKPRWEYVKYEKTGKPLFSRDYGHQWQVQFGQVNSVLSRASTDKNSLLAYDLELQKLGFSRTPIDRAGQKAGIKKILDQEADPNGYWHKYYEQIEHNRANPSQTFAQYLDEEFARKKFLQATETQPYLVALTYYAQLYELKVMFSVTDPAMTTNDLKLELKYGCKEEYDCYKQSP